MTKISRTTRHKMNCRKLKLFMFFRAADAKLFPKKQLTSAKQFVTI